MALCLSIFFGGVLVFMSFHCWKRLEDASRMSQEEWRLFLRWLLTGCITPLLLWFVFNLGLFTVPIWPNVTPITAGWKAWWDSFGSFSSISAFLITSYWTGVTFAWLL